MYMVSQLVPLRSNRLIPNGEGGYSPITPEGNEFILTEEWIDTFKDEKGNWREDWPSINAISICETEGCSQYHIQVEISLSINVDGVFRSICGGCNRAPALYEHPLS